MKQRVLYNMVCQGVTSRLEVASELLRQLRLDNVIRITEVSSGLVKNEYFAPRPDSERLIKRKLEVRGLNLMRSWQAALSDYLARDHRGYL